MARPHLTELQELTGETTNLTVLHRDEVVNIDRVGGTYRVETVGTIGGRYPLHCTAAGKVFLSGFAKRRVEVLIAKGLPRLTPNTICDRASLLREIDKVRTQGYAANREELEIGLYAVAAPIRGIGRRIAAALCVSGPVYRVTAQRIPDLGSILKCFAAEISTLIGADSTNGSVAGQNGHPPSG